MTFWEVFWLSVANALGFIFAALGTIVLLTIVVSIGAILVGPVTDRWFTRTQIRVRIIEKTSPSLTIVQPVSGGRPQIVRMGNAKLTREAPDSDVFILSLPVGAARIMGLIDEE